MRLLHERDNYGREGAQVVLMLGEGAK